MSSELHQYNNMTVCMSKYGRMSQIGGHAVHCFTIKADIRNWDTLDCTFKVNAPDLIPQGH